MTVSSGRARGRGGGVGRGGQAAAGGAARRVRAGVAEASSDVVEGSVGRAGKQRDAGRLSLLLSSVVFVVGDVVIAEKGCVQCVILCALDIAAIGIVHSLAVMCLVSIVAVVFAAVLLRVRVIE